MNPDDDDAVINQLKHPRLALEVLPRVGLDFVKALQHSKVVVNSKSTLDLQAFAEDELVRKEYKEMRCEMPGTPRSTFLMVFSPDGTKVASTHGNHNIYVTDLRSGKNIKTLVGHPRTPWCIAFHPTCNELVGSGCLGGQVRIWDLSGGSEVWTAGNQTVIASIAFHPNDRVLVIATYNELYFWDWSKPQPFTQTKTCNAKEKVRYVAFDKLGHKLITGIANTPQYRWERSRAAASQNRSERTRTSIPTPDRSVSPYRRRSVPRSLGSYVAYTSTTQMATSTTTTADRIPLSSVPERERRITACYRNLVHEYELLVHRYLQVYRPPATIDRGTDPMEMEQSIDVQEAGPSTRRTSGTSETPSPPVSKILPQSTTTPNSSDPSTSRCRLVLRSTLGIQTSTDSITESKPQETSGFQMKIKCSPKRTPTTTSENSLDRNLSHLKDTLANIQSELSMATTSTHNDANAPSTSSQAQTTGSDREPWRMQLKRLYPGFIKKTPKQNRKPILDTSSDSSSDDEDVVRKRSYTYSAPTTIPNINKPDNLLRSTEPSTSWSARRDYICNRKDNVCQNASVERPFCLSTFIENGGENSGRNCNDNVCDRCGGNIESQSETNIQNDSASTDTSTNTQTPPVSESQPCARTLMNTDTRTTNSTVYTPSSGSRRRFFSHVLSAFLPTRVNNSLPQFRHRQRSFNARSRLESITRSSGRLSNNFAADEVINYSERVNSEDETTEQPSTLNDFHPFDPPPEFPSINPENIGIGNMYSSIVHDLESSLNNVRNIQASNRPGETSDMLSSFSERLESIMHQSDSILRNLRNTMDMLPQNSESEVRRPQRLSPGPLLSSPDHPRFLFNDPNFYVRDQNQSSERSNVRTESVETFNNTNQHEELFSNRSAIASDHTYPRNPESPRTLTPTADNLTPLMTSLHLTISHIQRQARLLRVQVESIERIDRAMLEVAQIQNIRQMYGELRRILMNINSDSRNTGVSSVRQMMAGTRISDSSPGNSSVEEDLTSNRPSAEPSTSIFQDSSSSGLNESNPPRQRLPARKSFPPSRLLHIQRQSRRFAVVNFLPRRYSPRDRTIRRRVYFRTFSARPNPIRLGAELYERAFQENSRISYESLVYIQRKLEFLLTEYIRRIGVPNLPNQPIPHGIEEREGDIVRMLRLCRSRLNRLSGQTVEDTNTRMEGTSVTVDGVSRTLARGTLSCLLNNILRFIEENSSSSITQNVRSQIRNAIDLTSLFCDILLLHIVDSIPPPTGMNLDSERESLSARIDQMCSRMLQSRLSGHSQCLTRSLRLMRLTARYASRALGQTYNARRSAMFSNGNSSRRELIGQINNTLHCINNNRRVLQSNDTRSNADAPSEMPMREWYQTINALASRSNSNPTTSTDSNSNNNNNNNSNPPPGAAYSSELLERPRSAMLPSEDVSVSDDDNDRDWYNIERRQTLYRTNNVNLLNNDSTTYAPQSRSWNVPTVQINDVPISESNSTWHSRISHASYRLSELRTNPTGSLFRPRFLHPLYAGVNPFDTDIDDPQREQSYDGDMILTVTPNHRIQAWDISSGNIPDISNSMKNIVVGECKIHNDASVDISADGTILVTLLPSGGYLNVTNRLGVYSLRWETLGQCLYITSFEQNAVSVSLSPLSRHLVVGLASRRVSIVPNDKWTMARIFLLSQKDMPYGSRLPVLRELEQNRDTNYMSLNCIRWLPFSGQGLIYATNTGQLRILT